MRIAIFDADLIGRNNRGHHSFPNLACMKISGYHKDKGDTVTLITQYIKNGTGSDYSRYYNLYDKIYVSKVFVDTTVPYELLSLSITEYGGTGFFYANASPLPPEIENHMPDYHLYDQWIAQKKASGKSTDREFVYYEEYSIGFMTRYCVRHCPFCVNQHKNKVEFASHVKDFLQQTPIRNKICLLDDNILAYDNWKEVIEELNATGLSFEFKQGLDIRALTKEKAEVINNSNIYRNNIYFAFDNIKDKDIIIEKLSLWRKTYNKNTHMYVLCAFDSNNKYDTDFWSSDIEATLERIKICIEFGVFPYIMRFRKYNSAPKIFRGMYINLAAWCNQRNLFSRLSINQWADELQKANEKQLNKKRLYSTKRYLMEYAGQYPEIAYKYFDLKFDKNSKYKYIKRIKNSITKQENNIKIIKDISKQKIKSKVVQINSKQIIHSKSIVNNVFVPKKQTKNIPFFKSIILNYNNLNVLYNFGLKNPISAFVLNLDTKMFLKTDAVMLNTMLDIMQDNGEVYIVAFRDKNYEQILQELQLYNKHLILIEKFYSKYNNHIFIRYKFIKNKDSLFKNIDNKSKYFTKLSDCSLQDSLRIIGKHINIKYKSQNIPIVGFRTNLSFLKNIAEDFQMNIVNFQIKNSPFSSLNFRKFFGEKDGKYKTSQNLDKKQLRTIGK